MDEAVSRHCVHIDSVYNTICVIKYIGCLFPFQVQQYLEEAQMEMEVEITADDDPDKMKDVLAKLEVRTCDTFD